MNEPIDQEQVPPNGGSEILAALSKDWNNNDANKKAKSSMSACLAHFFPSKKRPDPAVASLVSRINSKDIQQAHALLLQNNFFQENATLLDCLKRVAATVLFVQLLLECRNVKTTTLSEQEANKMALLLVHNLTKTAKEKLQENENDDMSQGNDDESEKEAINLDTLSAPTVASFTVGALLKAVNPYVSSLPFLLSPLWKGICDIANGLNKLSPELADTTLRALLTYLQEGHDLTMATIRQYLKSCQLPQQQQQQAFQVKVLSFLVARCSVLLRVYNASQQPDETCISSTVMIDVATILLQLRGLTLGAESLLRENYNQVTQQDTSFLKAYKQLEPKVEQCLVKSWLQPSSSDSLVMPQRQGLQQLLRLQVETSTKQGNPRQVTCSSFAVGKALVLHRLLVQAVEDISSQSTLREHDVQSLLFICQELIFCTLPHCSLAVLDSSILANCLDTMASATALCYTRGPPEKRSNMDCLLLRWLAPTFTDNTQLHAVTREVAISSIHLHILRVCQANNTRSDSPRSVDMNSTVDNACVATVKPLLQLLVKVMLDPRTQTTHRRNIASVVTRIMTSHDEASSSSVIKAVSVTLQQVVMVEVQQVIQHDTKVQRRKRKHKNADSRNAIRPLGSFAADDIAVLVRVLQQVSLYNLPLLDRDLACVARDLVAAVAAGNKNASYTVGNYSCNALSLLLALLCGIINESKATKESPRRQAFKSKTGVDLDSFVTSLVKWLGQEQKRSAKSNRGWLRKGHSVVIVSSLRFLCAALSHVKMNSDNLGALAALIKDYARVSCQILRSNSPASDPDEQRSAASIIFAIAQVLAAITKVVPASCPNDILRGIAFTFKMLFATKSWPIVARTVTALVQFASTIPSAHQGILPECIPTEAQGLLQCRLQGLVFRDSESHSENESIAVNDECNKLLKRLIPVLETRDSLFVAASDGCIAAGSFIVKMPTHNGRTAQVIFAPGEDSLEEIKYMLGTEDIGGVEIRKLESVRLVGKGEGCRFLSKKCDV